MDVRAERRVEGELPEDLKRVRGKEGIFFRMADRSAFRSWVRTVLRSFYTGHYRQMLPHPLAALSFRSNNTAY
jgi:hypothetical protein